MRALLLLVSSAFACGPQNARFETADPHATPPPRRPPGVAVDPAARLPAPVPGGTSHSALLVLSSPRGLSAVHETLQRFFEAMVAEAPTELDALLSEQAWLDASSGRVPARNAFRSRFAQLDFTALRGVTLYRDGDLEIYRAPDVRGLAATRSVPEDLKPDEVFVRVRLVVSHSGKLRLFSDEMSLTLRSEASGFRISRISENTPVP
ncbi:MAG TPA: hypothetical protein VIM73_10695 [Polyangiaceae bacterium]